MGDPLTALGAAASVAQFVVIAVRVSTRIKDYCSTASNVPEAFRRLSIQLPLLVEVCSEYGKLPKADDSKAVDDTLEECTRQVDILEKMLTKAVPVKADSGPARALKAVISIGLEKKVEESIARLETLKTLLLLKIGLITYAVLRPPASSSASDTCFCVPSGRLSRFFGRTSILDRIDQILRPGSRDPKVCVLQGMGGQGKTSLALEYCKREIAAGHFKSILWVDAMSLAAVHRSFSHFAERLTDHRRVFPDVSACIDQVRTTLQSWAAPWLIVFDNYDRPDRLPGVLDYLPHCGNGAVLVTSRHSGTASLGETISIAGMDSVESIQLFLERSGMKYTVDNIESAELVVRTLGYLPLAIDQSAAYIRSKRISPTAFLKHYKDRKSKVMSFVPALSTYKGLKITGSVEEEQPLSVFTTWEMSFHQIWHTDDIIEPNAIGHFLTTMAFFSNTNLDLGLFRSFSDSDGVKHSWMPAFVDVDTSGWDEYACQDAVTALEQLSLIQYTDQHAHFANQSDDNSLHGRISFHPLVRDWIQLRVTPEARRAHCTEALQILHHYIEHKLPSATVDVRRELLSHLDSALSSQSQYFPDWALYRYDSLRHCLEGFMRFYLAQGRYKEAEEVCQKLLRADDSAAGAVQTLTLSTRLLLTDVYLQQGRYTAAEDELTHLRASDDSNLSSNMVLSSRLINNLGMSYFRQGRYDEAYSLLQELLKQQEALSPADDCSVLDTKELLAQVCRDRGEHEQAILLYESALEGFESLKERLRKLKCMVNLAHTYRSQAQCHQASDLYENARVQLEEQLGPDHPLTITTKMYHGINDIAMERYGTAEASLRDVVDRSVQVLGPKHPDSLKSMMNLAILLHRRDNAVEAEPLYRTTLDSREATLGFGNPYTMRTAECLVSLLWTQNRCDEAEALAARVMKAAKPRHSSAGSLDNNLPDFVESASSLDVEVFAFPGAEALFSQAVARSDATLDIAHRDRIDLYRALSRVYEKQGRLLDAQRMIRLADEGMRRAKATRLSIG
ncbi:hypothetical protein LTR95_004939 [Oleoguttula sp. CCFEE 5521]